MKIKRYFEFHKEYITYKNLWDAIKVVPGAKIIALNVLKARLKVSIDPLISYIRKRTVNPIYKLIN